MFCVDQLSGGSKEGAQGTRPPRGQNSFNFMQFLGKFDKFVCWRPPGELAPPPRGNPGSATATIYLNTSLQCNFFEVEKKV